MWRNLDQQEKGKEEAEEVVEMMPKQDEAFVADGDGELTLLTTVHLGSKKEFLELIEGGSSKEEADSEGNTALHLAAASGRLDFVEMILDRWPEMIEKTNNSGQTPVFIATTHGQTRALEMLLFYGGKADTMDDNGDSAIDFAYEMEAIRKILKEAGARWPADTNLLFDSVWARDIEGVKRELNNVDICEESSICPGYTALHVAADEGYTGIIELILSKWPDAINIQLQEGLTPTACGSWDPATLKLLLQKGGVADSQTKDGMTPLMFAAKYKDSVKSVEMLMEEKVDLQRTDDEGDTALLIAAQYGCRETVKVMLEEVVKENDNKKETLSNRKICKDPKCWVNARNADNEEALDFAVSNGWSESVKMMLALGGNIFKDGQIRSIKKEDLEEFMDSKITIERPFIVQEGEEMEESQNLEDRQLQLDFAFISTKHFWDEKNFKGKEGDEEDEEEGSQNDVALEIQKIQEAQPTTSEIGWLTDYISISTENKEMLKHPLPRALLMMKWQRLEKPYKAWFVLKIINFTVLLLLAICMTKVVPHPSNATLPVVENNVEKETLNGSTEEINITEIILLVCHALFWCFFLILEIFQTIPSIKLWLCDPKTKIQLTILIMSPAVIALLGLSNPAIPLKTLSPEYLIYLRQLGKHLAALLLPLTAFELLYELGNFPYFSLFILTFKRISLNFFTYLCVYSGLIGATVISFYAVMDYQLATFGDYFLKVVVMFLGEVEAGSFSQDRYLWMIEATIFMGFMFFLVVVLMNLLNALAIADASELREQAEMEMLHTLLHTLTSWENIDRDYPCLQHISAFFKLNKHNVLPKSRKVNFLLKPHEAPDRSWYSEVKSAIWKSVEETRYHALNPDNANLENLTHKHIKEITSKRKGNVDRLFSDVFLKESDVNNVRKKMTEEKNEPENLGNQMAAMRKELKEMKDLMHLLLSKSVKN